MAETSTLRAPGGMSLGTEEVDGDYEMDVDALEENADAHAANNQLLQSVVASRSQELDDDAEEAGASDIDGPEFAASEGDDAEGGSEDDLDDDAASLQDEGREDGSDDDYEDDGAEAVGDVKLRPDDEEDEEDVFDDESEAAMEALSGSSVGYQAADDDEDDDEDEKVSSSACIFCKQDELEDPGEDDEVYMACSVCGDNAHQQCARDDGSLSDGQNISKWACPACVENDLVPEEDTVVHRDEEPTQTSNSGSPRLAGDDKTKSMADTNTTADVPDEHESVPPGEDANTGLLALRFSARKITKDLLPSQKAKPDGFSIYEKLILPDDPMDGSRSLRKRKTSSAEAEDVRPSRIKRTKVTTSQPEATTNGVKNGEHAVEDDIMEDKHTVEPAPTRPVRIKINMQRPATIVKRSPSSLIVGITIDAALMADVLSKPPRPKKRKRPRPVASEVMPRITLAPVYNPQTYIQPFYALHDKETDESKIKPYGGVLTEAEADSSKSLPTAHDRRLFDDAKLRADEIRQAKLDARIEVEGVRKPKKGAGPVSSIECINFRGFEIETWYAAPYPEEYSRNRCIYICEFCLKYMSSDLVAYRHKAKCTSKHPPGDEIYREGAIGIFEVDGRKNPGYCQNLCLLAKLFLGSKTLYYDVEPFLFYVMAEYDKFGCHLVGYFSKEKRPSSLNNVSCILTLPIYQRKGYGNLLIDFSYLLTRVEEKTGSPEKPLSDMGLVSYRNYWRLIMCYELRNHKPGDKFCIQTLSQKTGMTADDIVSALEGLRALVKDPVTHTYAMRLDYQFFNESIAKWEEKGYVKLNEDALAWTPFVMGRQQASYLDHNPIGTVAPREEDGIPPEEDRKPLALTNGTSTLTNGIDETIDELSLDAPRSPLKFIASEQEVLNGIEDESVMHPNEERTGSSTHDLDSTKPLTNGHIEPDELADDPKDEPIPPTRFEVFPPITSSRRTPARPAPLRNASSFARPTPAPRTNSNRNRTTAGSARRRTPGSSRRSTTSSSRARNSARRKTGGTGRGPGRWPKGSKKADFGGADSGPGFAPGSGVKRTSSGDTDTKLEEDEDDEDAILYETPGRKRASTARSRRLTIVEPDEDMEDGAGGDDGDFVASDLLDADGEDED